jgi:ketosteroid isomerase-like protein
MVVRNCLRKRGRNVVHATSVGQVALVTLPSTDLAHGARMNRTRVRPMAMALPLLFAAACSGESNVAPQPAPIDSHAFELPRVFDAGASGPTEKERAAASTYAAAIASPAFAQLSPLLASEVHYAFPGLGDGRGKDGVLRLHEALFGAFDGRALAISRIWRTANAQTLEWTMTGTQARAWMDVAPTNKPVAIKGATILWTKDDGSLVDVHIYFDVAVVKAQLGAGPSELAGLPLPAPPSGAPQVNDQASTPQEESNAAVVHASLDALEKSDPGPYLDTLADDVEITNAEHAQPFRGKAEAKAAFAAIHKAIAQLDTTVDNKWGLKESVVVEYSFNGEQIAPLGWIPAGHDKVVALQMVDVVELRGGKIAKIWRYGNPGQIAVSSEPPSSNARSASDAGARKRP